MVKEQARYVASMGGWGAIREADEIYNGLNLDILRAYRDEYPGAVMGDFNYEGKPDVFQSIPEKDEDIRNFCCDFVLPEKNKELENLIVGFRTGKGECEKTLLASVEELGGEYFIWF